MLSHDEPSYGCCALKMLLDHNYIVPKYYFEETILADKPPLFPWLIAYSYKVFGISDFASRIPSAFSAILLVLFTWYIGKKILGTKTGLISAFILASSVEYLFLGRRAATDIVFCLFFSSSLYSMYMSYFNKKPKVKICWMILSGTFAGLALLTKGPVGILLQFLILTIFLIFKKQINIKHIKIYLIIGLVALIVSLPWYIAVHISTNGEFTKSFFFTQNIERFISVVGKHPGAFWFYLPILLLGFMPWTLFLIPALYDFLKHLRNKNFNSFTLFCLVWFSVIFIFFSFSKTKLATYILLAFPPISLISGYWLCILERKQLEAIKRTFLFLLLTIILLSPLSYFIITKSKFSLVDKNTFLSQILLSVGFFIVGSIMMMFPKKIHTLTISFIASFTLPAVFLLTSFLTIYYKYTFADLRDYAILAHKMNAKEIISFGTFHPIIPYYSKTPTDFNVSKKGQIKKMYNLLIRDHKVFIIGHLADIKKNNLIIKQNESLFKRLHIVKLSKKYFFGVIT